ncbi:MAG: aldo/keto reductase [Eubacterium sp.]|nr:aldo/keto reductase [Candidatus Colimonas fimequi]
MLYRKMGKLDVEVSLLGFGAMRLPVDSEGNIDDAASIALMRKAVDSGINYIDTAFLYPKSEKLIGKALQDGYREKVYIADKFPLATLRSEEDKESIFNKQLERLGVECIDFYLVHNVNKPLWKRAQKYDIISFLDQKKKEGKIKYLGFSFHDDFDLFKEVVDIYDWDFCQIQLNYMDKNLQAGVKGLDYATDKGMGVIIMEPLKGGRLTQNIPPAVQEIWDNAEDQKTPAQWAFKWLVSNPKVSLILSGMSNEEQLEANLAIFSDPDTEVITEAQEELLETVAEKYRSLIKYSCTGCGYCLPCPQKIGIPTLLGYFNDWNAFDHPTSAKFEYTNWMPKHGSDCIECHACEDKCPQHLPIAQAMKEAAEAFGL